MKKKFGIIGNPIKHSLSPVLHKYWFDKYGLDASYSIIETKDEDFKDVFERIRNHELAGINVTLPFNVVLEFNQSLSGLLSSNALLASPCHTLCV